MSEEEAKDSRDSRLLSLPPEIRNSIYRYTLVEEEICITPWDLSGASHPALLEVNRQIRSEATEIHYKENRFSWRIDDFDSKLFRKWQGSSAARFDARIVYTFSGRPSFRNLMEWLKAYHEGECHGPNRLAEKETDADVAAEMFAVLDHVDLSWDQIKQVLTCMRTAVGVYKSAWLEDA